MKNSKIDFTDIAILFGTLNTLAAMLYGYYYLYYLPNNPELNIFNENHKLYMLNIIVYNEIIFLAIIFYTFMKNILK